MFNNPRMKKKKHLASFEPAEIKFMQVYALNSCADQDYWFDLAMQLGYGSARSLQLLSLAPQIFTKTNSRSSSIGLPAVLMPSTSTPLEFSQCGKRPAQHELRGAPLKKSVAQSFQARSLSLPAMQLNSSQAPKSRSSNSVRRSTTGPASSTKRCTLEEFTSMTPPDVVLRSLSQCPVVSELKEAPVSVQYQHLSKRMTLEGSSFFTLPCTKFVSIDQLIIRIDQQ
jgi:hypothetical protein